MTEAAPSEKKAKHNFHLARSRFLDHFADLEEALGDRKQDKSLADEIAGLRAKRNDLVHSRLRFIQIDGQLHAVVINAREASEPARAARVLRMQDLAVLSKKLAP